MKVSVVIPAYNEEAGLPKVLEEIPKDIDEIVVVDNASTDSTYEVAKRSGARVIRHERNLGKVASIHTGIKNAEGDIIVLMDADYTYPAGYIPQFVAELKKGNDLIVGSRFMGEIEDMSFFNRRGNKILSLLATYASGVRITDSQSGYRAFSKDFFYKINPESKGFEFESEMTIKAARHGYRVVEIPIAYRKRIGESKLNPISDGLRIFKTLITIAYNETSILARAILLPALLMLGLGGYFGISSVYEIAMTNGLQRHPLYPLLTILFMILGIQLFSLGLIIDNLTKKLDRIHEMLTRER